ncbi:dihydrofolate reductase [Bacillus smithii]|uniref:dihydrofolate reductase n=1 Tax=Bacillus smithii TaxID=1479 RepID=UPI00065E7762|nr:dihydrofolate reductase [Bacillus smithii]AKP47495.1 Dihydrofolate reductase [Bacillus smithii]MED4882623.1 dihydrofolate reductase [Bacillus smithii]MED4927704.1 dihydrofolate reductase [Bacillus smithii]
MISLIVAMDENGVIGNENRLPWRLPEDLKFFKRTTMGHVIVMGRKTFESIGKPLPGRKNVVLTKNRSFRADNCTIVHSPEEVLAMNDQYGEIFIIGGAEIFRIFLPHAKRMYITKIHHHIAGDTYFPEVNWSEWRIEEKKKGIKDEQNPYDYEFLLFSRS